MRMIYATSRKAMLTSAIAPSAMALVSKALGLTTYLIDFLLIFCLSVISSFEADDGAPRKGSRLLIALNRLPSVS